MTLRNKPIEREKKVYVPRLSKKMDRGLNFCQFADIDDQAGEKNVLLGRPKQTARSASFTQN